MNGRPHSPHIVKSRRHLVEVLRLAYRQMWETLYVQTLKGLTCGQTAAGSRNVAPSAHNT